MKIAILGAAGSVGAPAAFYLAALGLADEILMVGGKKQNVLEHHALDISTAVSEQDILIRHGSYQDLSGSDIVINVAGAHKGLHLDRQGVLLEKTELIKKIALKIKNQCPDAVVITALNPVDALNYATYIAGGFDRKQVIGYSINDTFRFREAIASELKVKVSQVDGEVIGEHGRTQVPLFSTARVDGLPVTFSEELKQKIRQAPSEMIKRFEALDAGRTAGWTCAVGLAKITKAIIDNNNTVIPCSVVLEGEYGQRNMSLGVPVVLGEGGMKKILEYDLAPDEQQGLQTTIDALKPEAELVERTLA